MSSFPAAVAAGAIAPAVPLREIAAIGAGFFGIAVAWSVYDAYGAESGRSGARPRTA